MGLPLTLVEKIWEKLSATYGQSFLRQYDGVPIANVKAVWAQELAALRQSPQAIAYGLDNLNPEKAPNALQFRDLCKRSPQTLKALPPPSIDPEGLRRVTRELKKLKLDRRDDPRAWAYRLKEQDESGAGLTQTQRQCYKAVLGIISAGEDE